MYNFLCLLKYKLLVLTAMELTVFSSTSEVNANTDCSYSPTYNVELKMKVKTGKKSKSNQAHFFTRSGICTFAPTHNLFWRLKVDDERSKEEVVAVHHIT